MTPFRCEVFGFIERTHVDGDPFYISPVTYISPGAGRKDVGRGNQDKVVGLGLREVRVK